MESQFNEKKLLEIFIDIDDFCLALEKWLSKQPKIKLPPWGSALHRSEALTILVFYHFSGYKCFQYYYERMVLPVFRPYFPNIVSYKHFLSFIPKLYQHIHLFSQWRCAKNTRTGDYFIDSKRLPVCHNRRIYSNKVFTGVAQRGKSSTGWFYGLKLHLVINNLGQTVSFLFTAANKSDNNHKVLHKLLDNLKGNCYGDKGYISKLFEDFFIKGLHIVTKARKNMKPKLMGLHHKYVLMKRGVIESVNDILMTVLDMDHTRHRSPVNAIVHMNACLVAYDYLEQKPSIIIPNLIEKR